MEDKLGNTTSGSFGKGLILGSVVGATLALLYSSQSDINQHTHRLKNQAKSFLGTPQSSTNGATRNRRINA